MNKPPSRIWLQHYEGYDENGDWFNATWAAEPVNDDDVEYRIAAEAEALADVLEMVSGLVDDPTTRKLVTEVLIAYRRRPDRRPA